MFHYFPLTHRYYWGKRPSRSQQRGSTVLAGAQGKQKHLQHYRQAHTHTSVEVIRVGVRSVEVISVGARSVGVISVGARSVEVIRVGVISVEVRSVDVRSVGVISVEVISVGVISVEVISTFNIAA